MAKQCANFESTTVFLATDSYAINDARNEITELSVGLILAQVELEHKAEVCVCVCVCKKDLVISSKFCDKSCLTEPMLLTSL